MKFSIPTLLYSLVLASVALAAPSKRTSTQKYVFSHVLVGNTKPYTVDTWKRDIELAQASGIDAFALNVGPDDFTRDQVQAAYDAAEQLATDFKLFLSLDMSILPCSSESDAASLVSWVESYIRHPNQFMYPPELPRAFVSTFAGEYCYFGQSSPGEGWKKEFKDKFPLIDSIYFVPSFFVGPNDLGPAKFLDSMDGDFYWDSAWPTYMTPDSLNAALAPYGYNVDTLPNAAPGSPARQALHQILGSLDRDNQYIKAIHSSGVNKSYMASISPWFYTHYAPNSYNKNFLYLTGELYPSRWDSLIAARETVDLVEIISWNDFGESHYVGPIEGREPNSQSWVDGYDHTAWLEMTKHYATAFKTGAHPPVTEEKIFMWAHAQMKDAFANDFARPTNFALSEDSVFVLVFAALPGTVSISTTSDPSKGKTFDVLPGVTQLNIPLVPDGTMSAELSRAGISVVKVAPKDYRSSSSPPSYNYNAFIASSSISK